MTTRPMNLVIYLGAVGCSSSVMEEIQVKPFAFPQDVRLVVFGTKLFKVKVVFRGGQVREEDQASCAKDENTQNELKLILSQLLHCLSEANALHPIQSSRMVAYPMLAHWQAQAILEFYHKRVRLSPYRCALTIFVELKRGPSLAEREDKELCTPAGQIIPRKRGVASPLPADWASPSKRRDNRCDAVPHRHKQTQQCSHGNHEQHAVLPIEQAAMPTEMGGEGCGSVALETAGKGTTDEDLSRHGLHGNRTNWREQEGHAKAGIWRKLWTGFRGMFGY